MKERKSTLCRFKTWKHCSAFIRVDETPLGHYRNISIFILLLIGKKTKFYWLAQTSQKSDE